MAAGLPAGRNRQCHPGPRQLASIARDQGRDGLGVIRSAAGSSLQDKQLGCCERQESPRTKPGTAAKRSKAWRRSTAASPTVRRISKDIQTKLRSVASEQPCRPCEPLYGNLQRAEPSIGALHAPARPIDRRRDGASTDRSLVTAATGCSRCPAHLSESGGGRHMAWKPLKQWVVFSLCLSWALHGCGSDSSGPENLDATPPATIKDLTAGRRTSESVRLTWTAVGDDSITGVARSYDLRYSRWASDQWEQMNSASGEPTPGPAGQLDSTTVRGLSPCTTYHFRIKVVDGAQNWSGKSNLATRTTFGIGDSIPPAKIVDLSIGSTSYDGILLTWTAVGDDGTEGVASGYEIRMTDHFGETWDQMGMVNLHPTPSPAGQVDSVTVPWAVPCVRYRFRVAARDDAGNWSEPSSEIEGVAAPTGSHWCPMGHLVLPYALAEYQGTVVAGGDFEGSIASWDGQRWVTLGDGISGSHGVRALTGYKDGLVAGGLFNRAGDVDVHSIAFWNGSSWDSLGGGVEGIIKAMVVYRGDLIVAGSIRQAGGLPSTMWLAGMGTHGCP